jgi:hypothetical protein
MILGSLQVGPKMNDEVTFARGNAYLPAEAYYKKINTFLGNVQGEES